MNSETHIGLGRLPPPVFYLAALLTGIVLNSLWAMSPLPGSWRYILGSLLIGVSGLLITGVLRRFRRAGTTFDVRKAASVLITDGPYRFSRNPAYVSLTLLYLGVGIILNNGWILLLVVPILLVMELWVVRKEERHLETTFGEDYLRYKASVRRWL